MLSMQAEAALYTNTHVRSINGFLRFRNVTMFASCQLHIVIWLKDKTRKQRQASCYPSILLSIPSRWLSNALRLLQGESDLAS